MVKPITIDKTIEKLEEFARDRYGFRMFPTGSRYHYIFITMGLPGVGKSTYCELLSHSVPHCMVKVIKRDKIRMDLLWEMRKDEPEKQKEVINKLDDLTTAAVLDEFENAYNNDQHLTTFIFDGCYTEKKTMFNLLNGIRNIIQDDSVIVSVCIIGSPSSTSAYQLTDQDEGDYSAFDNTGAHHTIPKCIFRKKKKQMQDFLLDQEAFASMSFLVDYYYLIPSIDGRFIELGTQLKSNKIQ